MHSPQITKLCFYFTLYQLVNSSRDVSSKIEQLSKHKFDDLLEKFFVDLNKAFLQTYKPRHITIIGASLDDLQQVQPLFESYPYVICKDTERCSSYSQESFAIVFLRDLSEETIEKNIEVLSRCRKCKVLFVSNGIIHLNDVRFISTMAMRYNVPYSKLVHLGKNAVKLYSEFVETNCTMGVRLAYVWRPGLGSEKISTWALRSRQMNGCPVSVSSLNFASKLIIDENENGSLTVVGGRDGMLLLTLASKLNFTINLKYPSVVDQLKYSRKEAIIKAVTSGLAEIGIGRLRPNNYKNNTIAISFPYDEECITWGVPRVMKWSNNILWVEFSWQVWASIGLVFAVSCVIRYADSSIVISKNGQRTSLAFVSIVLDVFAIHLGNPVVHVSSSAGGRFMLMACLYYALVITTAYKTSLASILTTDVGTPAIVDAKGIIEANLDVGGSLYDYHILKDQVNESEVTAKLLDRFVINNNSSQSWNRLLYDHDYAFLGRRSSMHSDRQTIIKTHESVTFDLLNGCVLGYPTVMIFQARSFLLRPVDIVIQRLVESGIVWHWDGDKFDTEKLLKRKSAEKYFEKRAVYKFQNIFILYLFCISVSLLTFLTELLVPRLVSINRQHAVNLQFHHT